MRIFCEKEKLSRAIAVVSRAVAAKSNLAAIEGILLVAENDTLTLTGYDFEMGIKTTIDCRIEREGDVVLPSRLFANIVRNMEREEIMIDCDMRMNCRIVSGTADYNIKGIDSSEYPELPSSGEDRTLKIENTLFTEMCDYVLYAVSSDEKRPAHTGVQIKMEDDELVFVALDGFRLAVCRRKVDFEGDYSLIVPAKAMREVRALAYENEGKISIFASRRYIMFRVGDYIIVSRLLEGDFLDYRRAIPANYTTEVVLNSRKFYDSVERASLIITERLRNPVILGIKEGTLSVSCSTELGDVRDQINTQQTGPDLEIAFNNRYLSDALRAAKKDELVFKFSGPLSPCKIIPKDDEDFVYLVLPVRYRND